MPETHVPATSLWRDRSFIFYWSGRGISLLGTAITSVVLPILVYRLTASALLTSLLATLEVLPYFCEDFTFKNDKLPLQHTIPSLRYNGKQTTTMVTC